MIKTAEVKRFVLSCFLKVLTEDALGPVGYPWFGCINTKSSLISFFMSCSWNRRHSCV